MKSKSQINSFWSLLSYEKDFAASLRNVAGQAESLEAKLSYGLDAETTSERGLTPPTDFSFSGLFSKPLFGNPDSRLDFSIYKQVRGLQYAFGHDEASWGLFMKWKVRPAICIEFD